MFFELCVSEASLINTAGSLQIRVLCQTETLCNRKTKKKEKGKKSTHKIFPRTDVCLQIHIYSTIKVNMKMLIWFQAYARLSVDRNLNFFLSLNKKALVLAFFFLPGSKTWKIFICTTRAIPITATHTLAIFKMWNHKMFLRKKKPKCTLLFSLFSQSHRAVFKQEKVPELWDMRRFFRCASRGFPHSPENLNLKSRFLPSDPRCYIVLP